MDEPSDLTFCQKIPKVELHAHLNGSLSDETLEKLLHKNPQSNIKLASAIIRKGERRTMSEGFEMFKILHQIVTNTEIVFQVTKDVISDFALDGVKYLELRSTPRYVAETGMTKRLYMETVLNAIQTWNDENKNSQCIDVRYLPSIDRSMNVAGAYETVKLADEFMHSTDGLVVGIDFSGNPNANNGADYAGPLLSAKKSGLKLAVHMAEVEGQVEESRRFLELPPDRIGHGTYIWNDKEMCDVVLKKRIPLEICVTSNIKTKTVPEDHRMHHFTWWRREHSHPCIIGTDDKGIFATTLSREYDIAANAMNLSKREVFDWSEEAIDHVFADQHTKQQLHNTWSQYRKTL